MKNFKIFLSALLLLLGYSLGANAVSFIEGLEDIPIMDDMRQVQDDSIAFGNEESRLVEVYLEGNDLEFGSVAKFYADTLPQMGWKRQPDAYENSLVFFRDGEQIEVAKEGEKPLLVRITVKSRN